MVKLHGINLLLFIQVDGVERSMNDIDPNEIESISILKDASATAVFWVYEVQMALF